MSLDPVDIANRDNNNVQGGAILRNQGAKSGRAVGIFSATAGAAVGAFSLVGLDGVTPLKLPLGCTITRVVYKVLTTFTSATDAATIALSVVAANDVKTAIAISNGANPWDAATLPVATTPVAPTISTWLTCPTTGSPLPLVAAVAVEALTAGKLVAWVDWIYWGNIPVT